MPTDERYFDTKQVSLRLSIPYVTLCYWRSLGLGPAFHKFGSRVRYSERDLLQYEKSSRVIPSVQAFMEDHRGVS